MDAVLYVHGKGGSAAESGHFAPLFPGCRVTGLDYRGETPREAGPEIRAAVEELAAEGGAVDLIANSIGAYFSLHAGLDGLLRRAFFISPVVDMERLILGWMAALGVTEAELEARGSVPTPYGEDLSFAYLSWVRRHPVSWNVPTRILYGERDALVARDTVERFAARHGADLTVMEGGEHWFRTEEQMRYLDGWIKNG